jgi:hypothetical protein
MKATNRLAKLSFSSGFVLFFALGFFFFHWIAAENPGEQPIQYNHAVHIANGLECTECHTGARDEAQATLPGIDTCLLCHAEPLSESPEEEKIRSLAEAGKEIAWSQLTRVPSHVYFSHRRHVGVAGLECAQCHGAMETLTQPPARPLRRLSMEACMDCHRERSIRNDCNDCHR